MEVEYRHLAYKNQGAYLGQIATFAEKILRFVPRSIPDFPSHGVDHSIQIIKLIDSFVDNWDITLNEEEIFLLYSGAWLHDIGNIASREKHHVISARFIDETKVFDDIISSTTKEQLTILVAAHSSKFEIEKVPTNHKNVRLRFISSIFRIVDACEITNDKCPKEAYKLIDEYMPYDKKDCWVAINRPYWLAHMTIWGIEFQKPEIRFYAEDPETCENLTLHVTKEISEVADVLSMYNVEIPEVKVILDKERY